MGNPFDTERFLAAMAEQDENDPEFKLPGAQQDEEKNAEREAHEEARPGSESDEEDDPGEEAGLKDMLMRVLVDWMDETLPISSQNPNNHIKMNLHFRPTKSLHTHSESAS
jgi:hypothetical protein